MKKIFKLLMLAIATSFALASCEDVPMPYPTPDGTGSEDTPGNTIAPAGDGTAAAPFNVAGIKAFIDEGDYTGKMVYFTGIVTSFKSGEEPGNSYGNATFYIADETEGSNTFYCYRIKGFNNQKFNASDANLFSIGDTVTVCGNVTLYSGNTYETEQNTAYLVSVNGKGNGNNDQPGDDTPGEAKGSGTLADPYNVAAVLAYINTLGADKESANEVYIKGKVISNNTTDATISQFGNMTFDMADEGSNATFMAFQVYGPGKKKFTAASQIKVGDEVIVCGKVVNYKGNTPETIGKGQAYVVSINGEGEVGGNDQPSTDQPTSGTEINCAKAAELALALEDKAESAETYTVIGYITETNGTISRNQQVFWMADTKDGGKVFEAYWANIPDPTKALPVGTKVKMTGKLKRYGSTPEMQNGDVVVLEMGEGNSEGDNQGGEQTGNANEYTTTISYTLGASNAYDDGMATINGVEGVQTIKIGTSKNPGEFSFKSATGKVTFYAVTWKGAGSADVQFKDGDSVVKTVNVKANDGAANNAPYTMTVSSTDKYEIEIPAGKTITVTSDKRIIFFGLKEK